MQTTGAEAVPDGATGRGLLSRRPPRGPSHGRAPRLRPGVGVERPSGVRSILLATGRGRTLSPVSGGTGPGFSPSPRGPVIVGAVGGGGKYKKLCSGECRARTGASIPCGHGHRSVIPLVPVTTAESAVPAGSVCSTGSAASVGPGQVGARFRRGRRRRGPPGRLLPRHPGRRAGPHRRLPTRPAPRPGRQPGHLPRPGRLAAHLPRPRRPSRPRPAHHRIRPTDAGASRRPRRQRRLRLRRGFNRIPRPRNQTAPANGHYRRGPRRRPRSRRRSRHRGQKTARQHRHQRPNHLPRLRLGRGMAPDLEVRRCLPR